MASSAAAQDQYAEDAGHKYKLTGLPDFRKFRELALGESPEWKQHYKDELTQVESKPPGDDSTSLNIIRVRRIMPQVPPVVLYDQFQDAKYRATWDENMIEGYNIVLLNKHNDIGYYAAKFPWPLTNRDFCNQRSWMEFTNGDYVIFNHSEPHSSCPVKKGFIRAKSILTGYFMQSYNNGEGTVLTYVTHSDPCGSIPHALLNFVMTKFAPKLLVKCEQYSEAYPKFAAGAYPPGYVCPWHTPKMDWDSKYLSPEQELKARAVAADEAAAQHAAAGPAERAPAAASADPGAHPVALGAPPALPLGGAACGPLVSLAPVAPIDAKYGVAVQQYRAVLQDAMDSVDRSFLREGRAPTTKEYIVRLKYVIEGIQKTALAV